MYYTDQYGNDKDGWVVPVQLAVATKVPAAQAAVGTGAQAPIDHRLAPAPAAAQSSNYSETFLIPGGKKVSKSFIGKFIRDIHGPQQITIHRGPGSDRYGSNEIIISKIRTKNREFTEVPHLRVTLDGTNFFWVSEYIICLVPDIQEQHLMNHWQIEGGRGLLPLPQVSEQRVIKFVFMKKVIKRLIYIQIIFLEIVFLLGIIQDQRCKTNLEIN